MTRYSMRRKRAKCPPRAPPTTDAASRVGFDVATARPFARERARPAASRRSAPTRMREAQAYLARVGFTRRGDDLVLDLAPEVRSVS